MLNKIINAFKTKSELLDLIEEQSVQIQELESELDKKSKSIESYKRIARELGEIAYSRSK